jgi:hypothetical protein
MNYELKIFDTSDSYIIAFIGNGLNSDHIVPTYTALYKEIDISVNVIHTPYTIYSEETKEFIKETCGAVIPTSLPFCGRSSSHTKDGNSIVAKLINDLQLVIDFNTVRRFWKAYSKPSEDSSLINSNYPIDTSAFCYSLIEPSTEQDAAKEPSIDSPLTDAYDTKILPTNYSKKSSRDLEKVSYIMWNTTYSIAIVYDDLYDVIPYIERDFGEWEIVEKIGSSDVNLLASGRYVFHKKTFESINILKEKVACFKKLVGLDNKESSTVPTTLDTDVIAQKEPSINKDQLVDFIKRRFVFGVDKTNKVRATDLYKIICNEFCINFSEESFLKRKLIGHLLELGVSKKRYSDGYYFCDIRFREVSSGWSQQPASVALC